MYVTRECAVITESCEPYNNRSLNNSRFDRSYGNGTLNSFDFFIVSKEVKCACSGQMRGFSLIPITPFMYNVTHYSQHTVTLYCLKEVSFAG